jgi:thiol-disulfide isomerase/thioredoxin
LTTLDGRPFESAGKVAVLDFWATYCVPCIREIPMFDRLNQELGPKGVAVVGIAMDEEGAEIVKPFLAKHPMEYPVALGSAALAKQFATEDGLPVTLVFDRSGKLIKRFTGLTKEDELRAAVNGAM